MLFQLGDLGALNPHGVLATEPLLAAGSFLPLVFLSVVGYLQVGFGSLFMDRLISLVAEIFPVTN